MIKLVYGDFYSYERLHFTGLKIQKILNLAKEHGIIIKNAVALDSMNMEADVYLHQVKALKKLLNKEYKITTVKRHGAAYKIFSNKKRIFLWIMLPVMVAGLYTLFSRTWQVKVTGYDYESIKSIVVENGMLDWRKNAISRIEDVENAILTQNRDVLWTNVSVKGSVVQVFVKKDTSLKANDSGQGDIVAKKDCIIRNLIVTSGTQKVKNGQTVSEGQQLIEASQKFGEQVYPVKAEGKAIASVWYYGSEELFLDKTVYEDTGDFCQFYKINIFGKEVFSKSTKNFEDSRDVTEKINTFFLPIKIEKITRYETSPKTITVDKEEAIKEAEKEIINKLKLQIPEDAQVYETKTTVQETDGSLKICVYIETVENVAIRG